MEESNNDLRATMGMQIIDALTRQIGATVKLDVGGGTRFTVRFPEKPDQSL